MPGDDHWRFRVLGAFELCNGGHVIDVHGPKLRTMLATMVAHANRVVELDVLVDEVWGAHPPASAIANVRTYAAQLRRLLRERLRSHDTGYMVFIRDGELDLATYAERATTARRELAGGRDATGAIALAEAHAVWLGRPFAGVQLGEKLRGLRSAYEYDHLSITESYCEVRMRLGRHDEVVPMLREHVAEFPLREHAQALLMIALYRAGDIAAALTVYQRARAMLIDELGVDAGPELRRIQQAMLRRDPHLAVPASVAGDVHATL